MRAEEIPAAGFKGSSLMRAKRAKAPKQASQKLALINDPSIVVQYVAMNVNKKPFNDPRVRQALNYAVNKDAFNKIVFNGYADQLDSAEPPLITFYAKQGPWPYDPDKAKDLLKQAGYGNGFSATIWCSNATGSIQATQFLQQQFSAVGVK